MHRQKQTYLFIWIALASILLIVQPANQLQDAMSVSVDLNVLAFHLLNLNVSCEFLEHYWKRQNIDWNHLYHYGISSYTH